jgi:hypothetical protein
MVAEQHCRELHALTGNVADLRRRLTVESKGLAALARRVEALERRQ